MGRHMNEELGVLALVTSRLEEAGIAYMVTGSIAVSLYGEPRMTRDVDLVVALALSDAERLAGLFRDQFLCDEDRMREAIRHRSMFNLIHTQAVVKIDMIVRKDSAYAEKEFARRRRAQIGDVPMWVVSAEDLILSKLNSARDSRSEIQLRDVRSVIAAHSALDWAYLEAWAGTLGVSGLLAEARR